MPRLRVYQLARRSMLKNKVRWLGRVSPWKKRLTGDPIDPGPLGLSSGTTP